MVENVAEARMFAVDSLLGLSHGGSGWWLWEADPGVGA